MEDRIEKIFSEAKRLSLTTDEKSAGREMLRSYMALTPMRVTAAAAPARKPFFGFAPRLASKAMSAFSIALAFLLSAGSVSYAAEGAIPGDALYPVKVSVNEEVRAALELSAQAKASWEAERAERRLAEAGELARKGRLNAAARADLETKFRLHAERAQARIAALEESSESEAAADVSAHLEGSLHAHKQIFAMIAADADDDDDTEVEAFGATIEVATASAAEVRGKGEAKVAAEEAARAKVAAEGRRNAATHKIAEARSYLSAKKAKLGAEATAEAEARLTIADAAVAEGDALLAAGDSGTAFAAYAKAQRQAQEAKLLIRAGHQLKVHVRSDRPKIEAGIGGDSSADEKRPETAGDEALPEGDDDDAKPRGLEIKGDVRIEGDDEGTRGNVNAKVRL